MDGKKMRTFGLLKALLMVLLLLRLVFDTTAVRGQTTSPPGIVNLPVSSPASPFPAFFNANVGATGPAANTWMWMASRGTNFHDGNRGLEHVALLVSADGTNWSRSAAASIFSPDQYTNNSFGPISREWATFYYQGRWFAADNYDPYNAGGNSQGIEMWQSTDVTNWTRLSILYPFGTTNSQGCMFAPSWFQDTNGDVWMIMAYGKTGFADHLSCYSMKALDATLLNWGATNLIFNYVEGDGSAFNWDASVVRHTNGLYSLYYLDTDASGTWNRATNTSMTTQFVNEHKGDDFMHQVSSLGREGEGMKVIKISGTHYRAYVRNFNGGAGDQKEYYDDSLDDGATWGSTWTAVTGADGYWHGFGISMVPAQATNISYGIGTNYGQAALSVPAVLSDTVFAKEVTASGGIVTSNIFAQRGYFRRVTPESVQVVTGPTNSSAAAEAPAFQIVQRLLADGTNVVFQIVTRGSAETIAILTNGIIRTAGSVTATNGYFMPSNPVSAWPATPRTRGESFWGNSNGVIYLLTSTPAALIWAATNKIAP